MVHYHNYLTKKNIELNLLKNINYDKYDFTYISQITN